MRSADAHRLVPVIPFHNPAFREDPFPRAPFCLQPVFRFEPVLAALQMRGHGAENSFFLFRVDQILPSGYFRFQLGQGVSQQGRPALVKDDFARGNVPVPKSQFGPSQRHFQPVLAFLKQPGGLFDPRQMRPHQGMHQPGGNQHIGPAFHRLCPRHGFWTSQPKGQDLIRQENP